MHGSTAKMQAQLEGRNDISFLLAPKPRSPDASSGLSDSIYKPKTRDVTFYPVERGPYISVTCRAFFFFYNAKRDDAL